MPAPVPQPSNLSAQLRLRLAGISLSELARERVMRGRRSQPKSQPVPANDERFQAMAPALFAELSRLGNNLNQITRAFNAGRDINQDLVVNLLAEVWQTMLSDEVTARYATVAEAKVKARVASP